MAVINPPTGPRYTINTVDPFDYNLVWVGPKSGQFSVTDVPNALTIKSTSTPTTFNFHFKSGHKIAPQTKMVQLNVTIDITMSLKWTYGSAIFYPTDKYGTWLKFNRVLSSSVTVGSNGVHKYFLAYKTSTADLHGDMLGVVMQFYSKGGENRLYMRGEIEMLEYTNSINVEDSDDSDPWEGSDFDWEDLGSDLDVTEHDGQYCSQTEGNYGEPTSMVSLVLP